MDTTRIRRLAVLAAVAVTGTLALPSASAQAATASDFAGVWTGTDEVDGSNLLMVITRRQRIVLFDDRALVCDGEPALVTGRGTIDGDELRIDRFDVNCLGISPDLTVPYVLEFDATTGDLVELVPGPEPGDDAQTYQRLV